MKKVSFSRFLVAIVCVGAVVSVVACNVVPQEGPRVTSTTAQHGVPSAFVEWDAQQLSKHDGVYSVADRGPVPFTSLSVGWLAADHTLDPASFQVEIRTRREGAGWTEWVSLPGDVGPDGSPSGLFWSDPYIPEDGIHTDFEIRIRPPAGVSLARARVTVFDNSAVPVVANRIEVDPVVEETRLGVLFTTTGAPARPTIIPRTQWLGAERAWGVSQITITHGIVHHTVHANVARTLAQSEQLMRDMRSGHLARGWSDIGYNFVIDREGRIFQGRHNPWLNTTDVLGAHAGNANSRSVGIGLIGQFEPGASPAVGHPSSTSLRSLERLLAWRFHQRALNPHGWANINTVWGTRSVRRIAGHREVAATACPGANLQVRLPTVRTNVRALMP